MAEKIKPDGYDTALRRDWVSLERAQRLADKAEALEQEVERLQGRKGGGEFFLSTAIAHKLRTHKHDFSTRLCSHDLVEAADTIDALEQEVERLRVQASKCRWCGVPHERGMNTLCPFTIAERKLARLVEGLGQLADDLAYQEDDEFARRAANLAADAKATGEGK